MRAYSIGQKVDVVCGCIQYDNKKLIKSFDTLTGVVAGMLDYGWYLVDLGNGACPIRGEQMRERAR